VLVLRDVQHLTVDRLREHQAGAFAAHCRFPVKGPGK
jgi:hypothetical protein